MAKINFKQILKWLLYGLIISMLIIGTLFWANMLVSALLVRLNIKSGGFIVDLDLDIFNEILFLFPYCILVPIIVLQLLFPLNRKGKILIWIILVFSILTYLFLIKMLEDM